MYSDFPAVSEANRLDHMKPLDADAIRVTPAAAVTRMSTPKDHMFEVRLSLTNGISFFFIGSGTSMETPLR